MSLEQEEDYLRVGGSPTPLALTPPPPHPPAGVLGQKGRGATVGLNSWKKEEVVSARLPALTPSRLSRRAESSGRLLRGEEEESETP